MKKKIKKLMLIQRLHLLLKILNKKMKNNYKIKKIRNKKIKNKYK